MPKSKHESDDEIVDDSLAHFGGQKGKKHRYNVEEPLWAPRSFKDYEEGDHPLQNKAVNCPNGWTKNMSYGFKNRPDSARPLYFELDDKALPVERKEAKLNWDEKYMWSWVRTYTNKNVWYYRDRMNVPRGPANLPVLKECWVQGVIDDTTLIWGQGLCDFLPIRNVRTLLAQIRTPEVRFATWVKRNWALKPALARARKQRAAQRPVQNYCDQVDAMY